MKTNRQIISLLVLLMCSSVLFAQMPEWKLLGAKVVKFRTERDVIVVGADEGVFKRIKLTVHRSGVHFKDMKVYFANGDVIDVKIRNFIPAGGETRAIDLPGNNRVITKVVFWYESAGKSNKLATVRLYGRK